MTPGRDVMAKTTLIAPITGMLKGNQMRMLCRLAAFTALLASTLVGWGEDNGKLMLLLRNSRPDPSTGKAFYTCVGGQWKTANYGIVQKIYDKDNFRDGLAQDLAAAKLLVVGCYADADAEEVIADQRCQEALRAFLGAGGTLYFDFGSCFGGVKGRAFLKSVGVEIHPQSAPTSKGYPLEVPKGATHPLLTTPNDLVKLAVSYYGYRGTYAAQPGQIPLLSVKGEPGRCAALLQEGVLGKGRLLFSCVYGCPDLLIQNILVCAYGPLESNQSIAGIGKPTAGPPQFDSPTMLPGNTLNPLYLRGAMDTTWHKPDWGWRLPFVVREPLGLPRTGMTVSFERAFPNGVDPSSFRVVTPGGNELSCQSLLVDKEKNIYRVTFALDILGHETACLLLYYDNAAKAHPDYPPRLSLRREGGMYVLENSQIRAELHASRPAVAYLAPLHNPTGNQFYGDRNASPLGAGFTPYLVGMTVGSATVLEDGPVRKTLEYQISRPHSAPITCRYTMETGSPCLFYEFASTSRQGLGAGARWWPGDGSGLDDDYFVYPGKDGVRRIGFSTEDIPQLLPDAKKKLGEGWYAFEDSATGQTVGEIFDLSAATPCPYVYSGSWGYVSSATYRTSPAESQRVGIPP